MSEGKKRRVHTAEFKAKVGLEAIRVKWTRQSRQFFTEFKLSPRLHAQRNGAAPLSATASCCRPYLSTIFAPPPLASAYTLSGVR